MHSRSFFLLLVFSSKQRLLAQLEPSFQKNYRQFTTSLSSQPSVIFASQKSSWKLRCYQRTLHITSTCHTFACITLSFKAGNALLFNLNYFESHKVHLASTHLFDRKKRLFVCRKRACVDIFFQHDLLSLYDLFCLVVTSAAHLLSISCCFTLETNFFCFWPGLSPVILLHPGL